jgi:GAF domain-containing protein
MITNLPRFGSVWGTHPAGTTGRASQRRVMSRLESELTNTLTLLALAVLKERSLADDLQRLAVLATRHLTKSSCASVALLIDGEPSTVAVTDRIAFELDLAQYNTDEGPCLSALTSNTTRVAFLPTDDRFSRFAIRAADQQIISALSTPIQFNDKVSGTLNVYSRWANAFDNRDHDTAQLVAAEAANAIAKSQLLSRATTITEQLQAEYDEQALISCARDVVVALQDCSAEQALYLIHNAADTNDEPLVVIAQRILGSVTGDRPTKPHSGAC